MSELIQIGGIQPLMKILLAEGLLHGDCLTVTGKTLAENLEDVKPYPADQKVIRPMDNPVKKDSHLVVLRGNIATEGAVAKITGHEGLQFKGTAKCFHGEEAALKAILAGLIVAGDVFIAAATMASSASPRTGAPTMLRFLASAKNALLATVLLNAARNAMTRAFGTAGETKKPLPTWEPVCRKLAISRFSLVFIKSII